MSEALGPVPPCRAHRVDSSLIEFTMTFSVIARVNTADVPPEHRTWSQANEYVGEIIAKAMEQVAAEGGFPHVDSAILVEGLGVTPRSVQVHDDHAHCEHCD